MAVNDELERVQKLFFEKNYLLALNKINKILKKNKNNLDLINNRSSILIAMERFDEAKKDLQKIIQIEPNFVDAYINLGIIFHKQKSYEKAVDHYERAYQLDSKSFQSIFNLASLYLETDRSELAIEKLNTIYVDAYAIDYFHQLIAECYIRELLFDKALKHHKTAVEQNPYNSKNFFLLGVDYVWSGEKISAENNLIKALELDPKYPEAYFALSKIKNIDINSDFFQKIYQLTFDEKLDDRNKVFLHFALVNIYEINKDYEQAFKHMQLGNNLMKAINKYNFKKDLSLFEKTKSFYQLKIKDLDLNSSLNSSNKIPIFILGMPRSGTSMVEQIISNNQLIFGAGEINTLHEEFKKLLDSNEINKDLNLLQDTYLRKLERFSDKTHVIDKLPLNFLWIGFILKIFPQAKIIHTKRDAIATCFSIYRTLFVEGALEFSYSQKDILNFYSIYKNIMEFWEQENGNQFLQVSYEDLIENPLSESKRIFEFIGIDFEPNFLDIDKNKRWVRTASDVQVRGGIHKKSKEKWKNYENNLQEIISVIGDS